jgi:hypothetical protein
MADGLEEDMKLLSRSLHLSGIWNCSGVRNYRSV